MAMSGDNSDLELENSSCPDTSTSSASSISPYSVWAQNVASRRFLNYDERNATPMVNDTSEKSIIISQCQNSTLLNMCEIEEYENISINEKRISISDSSISQIGDDEQKTPVPISKVRSNAARSDKMFTVVQPPKAPSVPENFENSKEYSRGRESTLALEHSRAKSTVFERTKPSLKLDENQNVQPMTPDAPELEATQHFYWPKTEEAHEMNSVHDVSATASMLEWENYEDILGLLPLDKNSTAAASSRAANNLDFLDVGTPPRPDLLGHLVPVPQRPKKKKTSRMMSGLDPSCIIQKSETDRVVGEMCLRPRAKLVKPPN